MGEYILAYPNFDNKTFNTRMYNGGRWMGRVLFAMGDNQRQELDLTGPPGYGTGLYYGFTFEVRKDDWNVIKADEWVEVNPAAGAYYQVAQAQKGELEGKIKAGLASIQTAVSDYELIMHDIRKYEEYLIYIQNSESEDEKKKWEGELQLRTIFIDQVDRFVGGAPAGGGAAGRFAMVFMRDNNIMPTIVDEFTRVKSEKDFEKGGQFERGRMPEVERRMLQSKWIAYKEWKKIFASTIRGRLERLGPLARSRDKSIKEYREWLKPIIARHKLIEEEMGAAARTGKYGLGRKGMQTFFVRLAGTPVSFNGINFWIWKKYPVFEVFPTPGELIHKYYALKGRDFEEWGPLDEWTRNTLVFGREWGLINKYPWITDEWVKNGVKTALANKWWLPDYWYYTFTTIEMLRTNVKFMAGTELENAMVYLTNWMVSQNAVVVKCLEVLAIQEDFERYVDEVLGLEHKVPGRKVLWWWRKGLFKREYVAEEAATKMTHLFKTKAELRKHFPESEWFLVRHTPESALINNIKDLFRSIGFEFAISRYPGPYERGFYDRMNKYFLKPNGWRYIAHINLLKDIGKFGQPAG